MGKERLERDGAVFPGKAVREHWEKYLSTRQQNDKQNVGREAVKSDKPRKKIK
jgi:hypothetical protein